MAQQTVESILRMTGPGRVLHFGLRDEHLVATFLSRGVDAYGFVPDYIPMPLGVELRDRFFKALPLQLPAISSVVVESLYLDELDEEKRDELGTFFHRLTERFLVLYTNQYSADAVMWNTMRSYWQDWAFAHGFRLALRMVRAGDYAQLLQSDLLPPILVFEKIHPEVCSQWPAEHGMAIADASRNSHVAAEAELLRYAYALALARQSDAVVDLTSGVGAGAAAVSAHGFISKFTACVANDEVLEYARAAFAPQYDINFISRDAEALRAIPDASTDLVLALTAPTEEQEALALVREATRILSPDGRLFLSVPSPWLKPYGQGIPSTEKDMSAGGMLAFLADDFIIESRYIQFAPVGHPDGVQTHFIGLLPADEEYDGPYEWYFVVAVKKPSAISTAPYHHHSFDSGQGGEACWVVDFKTYYENPWLYRVLIQAGERLKDVGLLMRELRQLLAITNPASADRGAVMTTLGYQLLEQMKLADFRVLRDSITPYLDLASTNPHVLRWQISLRYLLGLGSLAEGNRIAADGWFASVADSDFVQATPLLATKTVGAWLWRGMIALLERNDIDVAKVCFRNGVKEAERALKSDWTNVTGRDDKPFVFSMGELGQIIDLADKCVRGLNNVEKFRTAPGAFWEMLNTGNASIWAWIHNVVRENEKLRAEMMRLQQLGRSS